MAPSKPQANGEKKGKPFEFDFNKNNLHLIFLQLEAGPRAL